MPVAATGCTRAVKVTLWPKTDAGLRLLVTIVVEAAWLTTWTNVALPLPAKMAEPLYVAMTLWLPAARVAAVIE